MKKLSYVLVAAFLAGLPTLALAAGTIDGGTKQAINWTAIGMFVAFVGLTLGITYWAAKQTASAADFYSAGGGITGFQNGLAIAGDYMSAASFLGISGLVYTSGYDGLIYSVGWVLGERERAAALFASACERSLTLTAAGASSSVMVPSAWESCSVA
mgnify:CR=1 FL=1